jgi:hypothetical protein
MKRERDTERKGQRERERKNEGVRYTGKQKR